MTIEGIIALQEASSFYAALARECLRLAVPEHLTLEMQHNAEVCARRAREAYIANFA